jgi:hypothetical protein
VKLPHPYLIFQTNFNRGWREYVEGFCYVMPLAMKGNWSGFFPGTGAYGFPPPHPVSVFLDYVDERFTREAHFYCAYGDSSTRMVIATTDARQKFGVFAGAGARPPDRFVKPTRGPTLLGGPHLQRDTLSVLTPVLPDHHETVARILKKFLPDEKSPLATVPDTHMARWAVVEPLPYKKGKRKIDSTYYLLFTSWFDGERAAYIRSMRSHLSSVPPRPEVGVPPLGNVADAVWGNCVGYPGTKDPDAFSKYMMAHSIRPGLAFAGYPEGKTEVRAADALHSRLSPTVARYAMMSDTELQEKWREEHGRRPDHLL